AHRMNDFRLYFANGSVYEKTELCFRDKGLQAHNNLNQSIDCNLSPTRNIYYFNRHTFVELCYIEINGCWKGFWGENCTVPCPPTCIDQHCHPANGSCIWGCDPSKCLLSCFVSTGICFGGCVLGRAGQYCNKYNLAYNQTANIFPLGQSNAGLSVDGLISTCIIFSSTATSSYLQVEFGTLSAITTVHFVFGRENTTADDGHTVYCSNTTDKWIDAILLYSGKRLDTDITIFAVCKYLTYVPPMLSANNMVELCEIEIGGCPYRRYGDNCEHVCPENCLGQGQCDLISGNCLSGCSDGWVGEQCDQGCWKGTWGTNCTDTCSPKCIDQHCYPSDGFCVWGCDPQNCRNNNCNNQTSVCTEGCVDGLVGQYCNTTSYEFAALINRVYNTGTRHPQWKMLDCLRSIV
ncbi:Hypothetical predicted protein, partial [Mytilus galloprovincialis]